MTSRDFCFWLQGFFEMSGQPTGISPAQSDLIRKHLALVFAHEIDPAMGDTKTQTQLDEIHGPADTLGYFTKHLTGPVRYRC